MGQVSLRPSTKQLFRNQLRMRDKYLRNWIPTKILFSFLAWLEQTNVKNCSHFPDRSSVKTHFLRNGETEQVDIKYLQKPQYVNFCFLQVICYICCRTFQTLCSRLDTQAWYITKRLRHFPILQHKSHIYLPTSVYEIKVTIPEHFTPIICHLTIIHCNRHTQWCNINVNKCRSFNKM